MPRCLICCPECAHKFVHSEITVDDQGAKPVLILRGKKLDIPESGVSLDCPNCKKTSVYKRDQLIYQKDWGTPR